jgi:hypothetical protein
MTIETGTYDGFVIQAGGTFGKVILWADSCGDPIDLTGATAKMDCKYKLSDASAFLSLSTENGRITIDGAAGKITLLVDAADTAPIDAGRGVYDLRLSLDGGDEIDYLLQGKITVEKMVTT